MEAELKVLKVERATAKRALTRIHNQVLSVEFSLFDLKTRLDVLKSNFCDLKLVQNKIYNLIEDTEIEEQEIYFIECEDIFLTASALINEKIETLEYNKNKNVIQASVLENDFEESSTSIYSDKSSHKRKICVKLPDIKLPTFCGKNEDWLMYRDLFIALIHENEDLSDVQKLQYLRGTLSDKALNVIKQIQISGENYELAWKRLVERYDNSRSMIDNYISQLCSLPSACKGLAKDLRNLLDTSILCVDALKKLHQSVEHWDMLIIHLVSMKLSNNIRVQWESQIKTNALPTWKEMQEFLHAKCRILETLEGDNTNRVSNNEPKGKSFSYAKSQSSTFALSNEFGNSCVLCKGHHYLNQCEQFIKMSPTIRSQKVKELKLCFNCLKYGHNTKQCKSNFKCRSCNKSHHSLLHFTSVSNNEQQQPQQQHYQLSQQRQTSQEVENVGSINNTIALNIFSANNQTLCNNNQVLLSTACILVKDVRGEFKSCRVLLDSASQSNFITQRMVSKLGLNLDHIQSQLVCGINQTSTKIKYQVSTSIQSRFNDFSIALNFLVIPQISGHLPTYKVSSIPIPNSVVLADPQFGQPDRIEMLLGAEIFLSVLETGRIKLAENLPVLQNTIFGWIDSGKVGDPSINNNVSVCHINVNQVLSDQLKQFWELETFENKVHFSEEEKECEQQFLKGVERHELGRYSVKLPLKGNVSSLGDSKQMALKRFNYLEKKLCNNPDLKQDYVNFMREYLILGHMELVGDIQQCLNQEYYLPHHAVIKPSSTSTKCRVVFDASASTSSGVSLNDILLSAKTQNDLMNIVMRFRLHKYVLIADVEKMFRQISMSEEDRKLQSIVWRENDNEPIKVYQLTTVTYGTSCAPFLATRVLKQLAIEERDKFPLASSAVLNDCYVDDILTGSDDFKSAKLLQEQLIKLFDSAKMSLKKWASNCETLLQDIPNSDRVCFSEYLNNDIDSVIKTLGLSWNTRRDTFKYSVTQFKQTENVTKRTILSAIASLFDPLGLIGPIIVKAKIIMQLLWQLELKWDDPVPIELKENWNEFRVDIEMIKQLELPRYIKPSSENLELHGYADASEKAYGACVYLRCQIDHNNFEVNLVCAKSRVAPLKQISIPKLELCAALLLSELISSVIEALQIKVTRVYLWSDSEVVLKWIEKSPHILKTFVANRVAIIQELTSEFTWLHISTNHNPADYLSRGISARDLMNCEIWWKGPSFLTKPQSEWIMKPVNMKNDNIPEQKQISVVLINQNKENNDFLNKFSSFRKLQRVVAYMNRFISNLRNNKQCKIRGHLTIRELNGALISIVKLIQVQEFSEELISLKLNQSVSKRSKIYSLNPFIDENDIIRVGGRLENSSKSFDKKHQMIIPKHFVTKLIVSSYHIEHLHVGQQGLLNVLRQQFWPISVKPIIKEVIKKCVVCFRVNPTTTEQLMGNLPMNRVQQFSPFINTGVDYCGPVYLRSNNKRSKLLSKAYICIFVCFAIKAVHVELVGDMTTESYIGALKCFVARRGRCEHIYSDNGSNFIGAKNELSDLLSLFNQEQHINEVREMCARDSIEFHFIPPRAPHFGGLWEAAVKSLKYHLKRVVGNAHLTYEQMKTVLCQIEAVLNSRPLTSNSTDPNDLVALTPGHILIGRPLTAIVEPSLSEIPLNRASKWQHVTKITQDFWKRWSSEYLNQLQNRPKWKSARKSLNIGDLVVIKEDNLPPLKWLMGRVCELHPGKDQQIRVVTVKTSFGTFKRPTVKLCILPIDAHSGG